MNDTTDQTLDHRLGARIKALRGERGWSLDALAGWSGVSRATLSRLENAEVSPTMVVLGKLCAAFGLTLSRLMHMVEGEFEPLIREPEQTVWVDAQTGFSRRAISPPASTLAGEAIEGRLKPGTCIEYDRPPRRGLEHHLVMLDGALRLTVDGRTFDLSAGDCLRYQLLGPSRFEAPDSQAARYHLFTV